MNYKNNRLKKRHIIILVIYFSNFFAISEQKKIITIFNEVRNNNPQIVTAKMDYENAKRLSKSNGGIFAPGFVISGGRDSLEQYSTSLTYKQPFLGGLDFLISNTYSFESRAHELSFSLVQSLFPFWVQGMIEDPEVLSYKLLEEYYYNQVVYIEQEVFQELLQYYAYALSDYLKILSLNNSINLLQAQIDSLYELKQAGAVNSVELIEYENSKGAYSQDLLSTKASYLSYIQRIKSLSGLDIEVKDLFNIEDFDSFLSEYNIVPKEFVEYDPYEKSLLLKIRMAENKITSLRQENAPTLELSSNILIEMDYKKSKDWTFGFSFDFTPLISAKSTHNRTKAESEAELARLSYSSYLCQKKYLREQYKDIINNYEEQMHIEKNMILQYERQVEDTRFQFLKGSATALDLQSEITRLENCRLQYNSLCIYVWLYKNLEIFTAE